MTIGIMQPYVVPYVGYFQLIKAVDTFVIYDDVNFIKQGWINRNRILLSGQPFMFTIPLANASSFAKINDVLVDNRSYGIWLEKFYRTLQQAYKKAPFYTEVLDVVRSAFNNYTGDIGGLARNSIRAICSYLGIQTAIVESSAVLANDHLSGPARVIDICKRLNGNEYINAIGGQELYSRKLFSENGIELKFIKSNDVYYQQYANEFVPWLSMIDVMMFNSIGDVNAQVDNYNLI